MKQIQILFIAILFSFPLYAQVVWTEPAFPSQEDDIILYFDATQGNGGLEDFVGEVYAHMGLITSESTSPTDWQYVVGTWGVADDKVLMTREGPNLYSKSYNISDFHQVDPGELVKELAFVFRSADGSVSGRAADGSDIYTEVFPPTDGLLATLYEPVKNTILFEIQELNIDLQINREAEVLITDNGAEIYNDRTQVVQLTLPAENPGQHELIVRVTDGMDSEVITRNYLVLDPNEDRIDSPAWISDSGLSFTLS